MDPKEAFSILSQVAEQFKGTLKEHQAIQAALKTLKPKESEAGHE